MAVNSKIEQTKKEEILDDISDKQISKSEKANDDLDPEKLEELRKKMSQKRKEKMPPKIVEEERKAIKFGIIGSGQCGGNLAQLWYSLGYPAVVCNTARQDLEFIDLPDSNKLLFEYGLGGAGKELSIGKEAAEAHRDALYELIQDKLADTEMYIFCTSLGGGSGAGSAEIIVDMLAKTGQPIIVMTVLPMTNEDVQTKNNALISLSNLAKKVKDKIIHNLIVVDNAKIESMFSDVSQMDFYSISNAAIVEPLDMINTFSAKPSGVKGLDPTDLSKILIDGEGLSLYGCMSVYDYEDDTALANAVVEIDDGLLASGFDLHQTKYVGAIFLANSKVWKNIPSSSVNYAMTMIDEVANTPLGKFKGIYEADIKENVVKVYSIFTGLALPDSRIEELKNEVQTQKILLKTKNVQRNMNLNLNTGETETVSAVEKIKQKIEKKKSMFGKFTKNIIDKRK